MSPLKFRGVGAYRVCCYSTLGILARRAAVHHKPPLSRTLQAGTNSLASPSVTFGVSFFAVFLGHPLCTKENCRSFKGQHD